ncbi:osteopontin isoform X2 [Platichthys flesus]|uniref:osteopontin isoform X2 n=1 Tax=Platichthys flesus TaxID=8260 RepID=UPI002DB9E9A5|nr:osteopontin isoform X2 [Platichthys flesus]
MKVRTRCDCKCLSRKSGRGRREVDHCAVNHTISRAASRLAAARGWRVYKPRVQQQHHRAANTTQEINSRENPVHLFLLNSSLQLQNKTTNSDTMKVAVVFILLFATVLCRPARKVPLSSSESSEEVLRREAARKQAALVPLTRAAPVQAAPSASDESAESSEQEAAVAPVVEDQSGSPDPTPTTDTTDSQDSEDDDDDDDVTEETEEEEDKSSDSSESGESSSPAPATVSPTVFTEEPMIETTEDPILPTIVIDPETARGDSLGKYPNEYKSIIYVEDKSYNKLPSPYKSWEYVSTGKKAAYEMTEGNDVEKSMPVYKALQVHSDILEEDTSTPEMESQGLDVTQDQEITPRQASLPAEEGEESTSDATTNESSSATQEEEDESTSASSASASAESQDEESSEEATATPGAADSDSDESTENDSDEEEGAIPDATTDVPMVIAAK